MKHTFHHGKHTGYSECVISGQKLRVCTVMLRSFDLETLKRAWLCTGAVLETIMAKMDGVQGDRISVGGSLRDLPYLCDDILSDQETRTQSCCCLLPLHSSFRSWAHAKSHHGAGVAMMKVRRQSDGHVLGGWAAEYKGHGTDQLVRKILHEDLNGMLKRSAHSLLHTAHHDCHLSTSPELEHSCWPHASEIITGAK